MSENPRLKVAFLWHMHQPFYLNPATKQFMMPWVRLHGLKDYLDMPLLASQFPNIKLTFNLVPSLLDQIQLYCEGYSDRHLELSRVPARNLSDDEKIEILSTFFSANPHNMIEPYLRYHHLYRKRENSGSDLRLAIDLFSVSEWRDLQVWSNLVWIDPSFRMESAIRDLYEKGRDFTEEEKIRLLDFEIDLLKRIIPTYQRLYAEGRIDISFTPYYHPILPLLVDTNCASDALPGISLPEHRFQNPEDARWHIQNTIEKFKSQFGGSPQGMWPSEGSISEDVLRIMADTGVRWTATDEDILRYSVAREGSGVRGFSPHMAYCFSGAPALKIFFRDRGLSDKIGFVYSSWETDKAVADFLQHLARLKEFLKGSLDRTIVPIILDGENAWEYYPNDGIDFLKGMYTALSSAKDIEVISFTDAAKILEPGNIQSVMAGSWINHNFRVWIGHSEDNMAWDILHEARKALVDYQKIHPDADSARLESAWRQIYIAEGSDWCWWYGDEHIGENNEQFDLLFRLHVKAVYDILGLTPPSILSKPIHRSRTDSLISPPESLVTPKLDGILTHYYEWSGAGHYDCAKVGGAMHRGDRIIDGIHFAFDSDNFYIRIDFAHEPDLIDARKRRILVDFRNLAQKEIILDRHVLQDRGDYRYIFGDILEAEFSRSALFPNGSGRLEFYISLYLDDQFIEKWPLDDPIGVDIPDREREIFWQV